MTDTENGYKFESTGREFYANGYIGIMELTDEFLIAQGYDGMISPEPATGREFIDYNSLTKEEVVELSNHMIKVWSKFAETYVQILPSST